MALVILPEFDLYIINRLITVDRSALAIYIHLEPQEIIKNTYFHSKSIDNNKNVIINLDLAKDNKLLGIEMIFSTKFQLTKFIKNISKHTQNIKDITNEKRTEEDLVFP